MKQQESLRNSHPDDDPVGNFPGTRENFQPWAAGGPALGFKTNEGLQWRRNHCHACFLAGLNRPWHCHRQAALLRFWLNPVSDSDSSACHRDRDGSGLTRSGNLNLVSQPLRLAARLRASRTEKRKVTHGTGIAEHSCLDLGEILVPGWQRPGESGKETQSPQGQ